jgi:hypothetical protein
MRQKTSTYEDLILSPTKQPEEQIMSLTETHNHCNFCGKPRAGGWCMDKLCIGSFDGATEHYLTNKEGHTEPLDIGEEDLEDE